MLNFRLKTYHFIALSKVVFGPDGRESKRTRLPSEKTISSPFQGFCGQISERLKLMFDDLSKYEYTIYRSFLPLTMTMAEWI